MERQKKTIHLWKSILVPLSNEISGISAVRFSFQCIMDICHATGGNMAKGPPYVIYVKFCAKM